MTSLLAAARSLAARARPHLPAERVVAARAAAGAVDAAAWFAPTLLLVVGTPPPLVGLFGALWLALGRPEHGDRVLAALRLDGPLVRRGLVVAGLALWTLAPLVAPRSGVPAWAWFCAGLVGIAPVTGLGARPDGRSVVSGPALGSALSLVALAPVLAAGGVVAGVRTALAAATALGVLALTLGVPGPDSGSGLGSGHTPAPDASALSTRALVDALERLPHPERRLLLADCWARCGLALIGPFFVAFGVRRLPGTSAAGAAVVAACLALAVAGAAGLRRALPRVRSAGAWTTPALAALAFGVAFAAPLAVLLVPPTPATFAGTFLAVGLGQVGWIAVSEQVGAALGDSRATYRAVRTLAVALAALAGGFLYAVAPAVAFVVSSACGAVGAASYLRRGLP